MEFEKRTGATMEVAQSLLLRKIESACGYMAETSLTSGHRELKIVRLGRFGSIRPQDRLIVSEDISGQS